MVKLKKILAILLVMAFLIEITPVFAQARYGTRLSAAVQASTALVLGAGTWVYGIKIFADASDSFMGIYNASTLATCLDTTVMDELGEATQYDTAEKHFTKPVYFGTGVSVLINTGVAWVEYGPEP